MVEGAVYPKPPRRIGHHQPVHVTIEFIAFRAVRYFQRGQIQAVILCQLESGVIGNFRVGAIQQLQKILCVGVIGDPGDARYLKFADLAVFEQVSKLHRHRGHTQTHRRHALDPELRRLSGFLFVGAVFVFEHNRAAIGHLAPAVAILVKITKHIQQGTRPRRVVFLLGAAKSRVKTHHTRAHRRHGGCRLAAPHNVDFLVAVVGVDNGAPERNVFRLVAADDGIVHVEGVVGDLGLHFVEHPHVAFRQHRREVAGRAIRDQLLHKRQRGFLDVIVFVVHEGEITRLLFFNWRNDDAVNQRQRLAAK